MSAFSPTVELRIIAQQSGQHLLLLYVDQHDPTYDWARRRRLRTDVESQTVVLEILHEAEVNDVVPTPTPYGARLKQQLVLQR